MRNRTHADHGGPGMTFRVRGMPQQAPRFLRRIRERAWEGTGKGAAPGYCAMKPFSARIPPVHEQGARPGMSAMNPVEKNEKNEENNSHFGASRSFPAPTGGLTGPDGSGTMIADRGSRIADRGSRIADRGGSRIADRGSRIADRGSRIADALPASVARGLSSPPDSSSSPPGSSGSPSRSSSSLRSSGSRPRRGLRSSLSAFLLLLPLLAGLTAGAEAQTVSISAPADANEGSAGGRDIQFSLSHSGTTPTNDAIVRTCFTGTATRSTSPTTFSAGSDYRLNDSGWTWIGGNCIDVPIGANYVNPQTITLRIVGDTESEPDETIIGTVSFRGTPGGTWSLGTSTATHTIVEDDLTLTLSIPDDLAVEDDFDNEAQIRVALSRALVSGETVTVPLNFAGASRPADFNLLLGSNFTGVSLSGNTVTFTGPSVASATMNVLAVSDSTDDDETVTVSLGTVTSTGVTVASSTRSGDGEIRLLETVPYTASPGPPLVIVDSIIPVHGSCAGRECETTEVPAGNDIIINARLVRPALEKGVGFIPVVATRQIAVNAYLQPGVHAHEWLTPLTFAVGEKSKTALLRLETSTLVESDVRRMLMFSGPVGSWGEGNPPPFGVVTNDPYWITIKDGPDGSAGNIVPVVTVGQWHQQKLDGGVAEGTPVNFEVKSATPAQGPFTVYLKVEETAGDCVAMANERVHTVSFAPRVGSTVLTVPTVNDGTAEPDCTVRASLARADGTVPADGTTTQVLTNGRFGYTIDTNGLSVGGHTFPHRAAATATVRDDDSVARKVSFVTNPQQVQESTAGRVDLVVAVDPAPSAALTLNYGLSGSATRGADYTVPSTVTVPPGATTATIPVTIIDDSVEDSGEWVVVHLEASGGYQPFTPVRSAIRILNHEPGQGAPDWTDYQTVVDHLIAARDNPANKAVKGNPAHIRKWNRVLASIGHAASPEEAMPASEIHGNAAKWPDSPFWAASVYLSSLEQGQDQPQQQTPEIAVTGGSAVTEGGDAVFTLTATPAPAADLAVSVTVASDGDWGVTAGTRTVTIPTTGSATLTLATEGDDADEPDGSVSVTVAAGSGWTVGSSGSGTVSVLDDDDAAPAVAAVDPALVAEVRAMAEQTHHGAAHVKRWRRVLLAFGVEDHPGLTPTTLAEAKANAQKYSSPLWPRIVEALEKLAAAPDTPPLTPPEIAVSAGSAVTEGGDAVFTLTATPAPAADLTVSVTVAADGDWGVTAGSRTVTIPTTGSATLTLATADDDADEPDGSVTVTVDDGTGYTVGASASGTVAVSDDDAPLPVVTLAAGAAVTEGGDASFTLTASPAPAADLTVSVTVAADGDWGVTAGTRTVTIPTTGSATLTLATADDDADEPDGSVTVTVDDGTGYTVGASASGTVAVSDDDLPPPVVTVAAKAGSVTEGGDAVFTLTASPAPAADLSVSVSVAAEGEFGITSGTRTVTIPTTGSFVLTLPTTDDSADEPDGEVTVTIGSGADYDIGDPASGTVSVADDDAPAMARGPVLWVDDSTAEEGGRLPIMPFTVRLSPASVETVRVHVSTRPSDPVSAEPGVDYAPGSYDLTFRAGETEKVVWILIHDDSHDEGRETFEVVLSNARGAAIGDGIAVATITNDDPMPAAFLSRFGRTVAQQALDGISERLSAARTPGLQASPFLSSVAGAFTGSGSASGAGIPMDTNQVDPMFVEKFEAGPGGNGETSRRNLRELVGNGFSMTGSDGSGGSGAFWGRVSEGRFDGREGTFALDGEASTAMLGADWSAGRWLMGLALSDSGGGGNYRDDGSGESSCPEGMEGMNATEDEGNLCDGGIRAGDGKVDASLTALIPYASVRATEAMRIWGAAGFGEGDVTLRTDLGGRYRADTEWTMFFLGLSSDLLTAREEGVGLNLKTKADALWARTESKGAAGLAGSASEATRLRLGLEGSWGIALSGDARLTPGLEFGIRRDGGDAETGTGIEAGGSLSWQDPQRGISLDLRGRTLVSHGNDDLEDRGFSASVAYDREPSTERGLSLRLVRDRGTAAGGLEALFAPTPLEDRDAGNGTGERWNLEAAYGLPAFGGRYTGSPHAGVGIGGDDGNLRDWTVGWRWSPEGTAPDVSFGLRAVRREGDGTSPENVLGFELTGRW